MCTVSESLAQELDADNNSFKQGHERTVSMSESVTPAFQHLKTGGLPFVFRGEGDRTLNPTVFSEKSPSDTGMPYKREISGYPRENIYGK